MPKKIFIDCGAWEGVSIKFFMEHYPNFNEFDIYAFECNRRLIDKLRLINNVHIIPKAVWINNDIVNLYIGDGKYSESSSVIIEKKTGKLNKANPDAVECIDFSKWLIDNFNLDDYIIVKMNIEGAEYNVLEKMLCDNSIDLIDKLYIQWHWNKISLDKQKHDGIASRVINRTRVFPWVLDHKKHNGLLPDGWKESIDE